MKRPRRIWWCLGACALALAAVWWSLYAPVGSPGVDIRLLGYTNSMGSLGADVLGLSDVPHDARVTLLPPAHALLQLSNGTGRAILLGEMAARDVTKRDRRGFGRPLGYWSPVDQGLPSRLAPGGVVTAELKLVSRPGPWMAEFYFLPLGLREKMFMRSQGHLPGTMQGWLERFAPKFERAMVEFGPVTNAPLVLSPVR